MKQQPEPRLTTREKAQVAGYMARMCKRGIAGDGVYQGDLERRIERITDGAAKRHDRESAVMAVHLETTRQAVAVAKTELRTADRADRAAAKAALKSAEDALRRTERAARDLGL
ncbi:DUF6257 family protein [Streptomyces sp. NBC_00859]|uniref:DUF6257 family protein n=1 Tax=Streptomyces sp. NBC_00859 TaxID=2903682 RepID=UPI002F916B51|nr:DUF6257 family protein [Streptomyces sp. NBC_00859]WSZ87256.1 DUF6257 family protein [Streptomyces sp. NBC_00859]